MSLLAALDDGMSDDDDIPLSELRGASANVNESGPSSPKRRKLSAAGPESDSTVPEPFSPFYDKDLPRTRHTETFKPKGVDRADIVVGSILRALSDGIIAASCDCEGLAEEPLQEWAVDAFRNLISSSRPDPRAAIAGNVWARRLGQIYISEGAAPLKAYLVQNLRSLKWKSAPHTESFSSLQEALEEHMIKCLASLLKSFRTGKGFLAERESALVGFLRWLLEMFRHWNENGGNDFFSTHMSRDKRDLLTNTIQKAGKGLKDKALCQELVEVIRTAVAKANRIPRISPDSQPKASHEPKPPLSSQGASAESAAARGTSGPQPSQSIPGSKATEAPLTANKRTGASPSGSSSVPFFPKSGPVLSTSTPRREATGVAQGHQTEVSRSPGMQKLPLERLPVSAPSAGSPKLTSPTLTSPRVGFRSAIVPSVGATAAGHGKPEKSYQQGTVRVDQLEVQANGGQRAFLPDVQPGPSLLRATPSQKGKGISWPAPSRGVESRGNLTAADRIVELQDRGDIMHLFSDRSDPLDLDKMPAFLREERLAACSRVSVHAVMALHGALRTHIERLMAERRNEAWEPPGYVRIAYPTPRLEEGSRGQ